MTTEERKACVQRGIQYLNKTYPGWVQMIKLDSLWLRSSNNCVLCQASGKSFDACSSSLTHEQCWNLAFGALEEDFDELEEIWKEEISKLKENK